MKQEKAKELIDVALDRLGEALDRGVSDTMKTYLAAMARFRQYSWGNVLLIALARPDATQVAGYRTWQKLGRQVNRGEKGIVILAPVVMRRRKEDDGDEDEDESKENRVFSFKAAHVFDVSQTSGERLPEATRVRGDPGAYLPRMKELVAECGIELTYSDRLVRADGASCGGRIVIRSGLPAAEDLSVIAHELAHELLHRSARQTAKTVLETEAEAVAYVVCGALGLDTNTASSDYIRTWQGTRETLAASLRRIHETAMRILDGVMEAEQDDAPVASSEIAVPASLAA